MERFGARSSPRVMVLLRRFTLAFYRARKSCGCGASFLGQRSFGAKNRAGLRGDGEFFEELGSLAQGDSGELEIGGDPAIQRGERLGLPGREKWAAAHSKSRVMASACGRFFSFSINSPSKSS
jgi:hypothetical protein